MDGQSLSVKAILERCKEALTVSLADMIIIEGAGGWMVPLNGEETMADLAKGFNYPIILVVGMRLGCLNHALLSYANILASNQLIAGWVANVISPEWNDQPAEYLDENIRTLQQRIAAPLLGIIPYQPRVELSEFVNRLEMGTLSLLKTQRNFTAGKM